MTSLLLTNHSGLTAAQFDALADVPPELEWLANITNAKTRRAHKIDVSELFAFARLAKFRRSCAASLASRM